jgi:hypothetical protein
MFTIVFQTLCLLVHYMVFFLASIIPFQITIMMLSNYTPVILVVPWLQIEGEKMKPKCKHNNMNQF